MSQVQKSKSTKAESLLSSAEFKKLESDFISLVSDRGRQLEQVEPAQEKSIQTYEETIQSFQKDRGRELFYPYVGSGFGSGPFVELLDGSVKYDMITGIGVHFFGRNHPELLREVFRGSVSEVMQGNLQPSKEAAELLRAILSRTGQKSRLRKGWITTCGTMANEIALKIIRQKRFPATKVIAFQDCFAGRSTAMQEITDNAKYRDGQPTYGEVLYLPFYDAALGLERSIEKTLSNLSEHLARYPGKICALMMELVQGEGGFRYAPREYYVAVFEAAKKAGMAIWFDEIQTFGRTGELFAYQTLGLEEYPDVVTVAKMLLSSVVLFSEEYNPKAGLVAGTFTGGAMQLRASRRVLELLEEGKYLGSAGRIQQLSNRFKHRLEKMKLGTCTGKIGELRILGGMIAFMPMEGTLDQVKRLLNHLFYQGVVAFYCGHDPYFIRMLPPFGAMTEEQVDQVCDKIERSIQEVFA